MNCSKSMTLISALSLAIFAQGVDAQALSKGTADPSYCTTGAAPGTSFPGNGGYGLYLEGGLYFAGSVPSGAGTPPCEWATVARYRLDLPQLSSTATARLNLSTGLTVTSLAGTNRHLRASTISPLVCTSFLDPAAPPAGVNLGTTYAIEITNGGGQRQGGLCTPGQAGTDPSRCLWGVSSLSLAPAAAPAASVLNAGLLQHSSGAPYIQCYDATTANATLAAGPAPGDLIFADNFEVPAPDVRVQFVRDDSVQDPIENLVHTVNVPGAYRVLVSNRTGTALSGVRLREFLPGTGGVLSPLVDAISCTELTGASPVSCAGGTSLDMDIDLAANQTRVFRIERQVRSNNAIDPTVGGLVAVAAFVNPAQGADADPSDNVRSLRLGTVTLPSYVVSAAVSGGNGTVSPTSQQITQGQSASFTLAPAANYQVNTATDNCGAGGTSAGTRTNLSYSIPNITQACTLTVSYRPVQYAVTATAGANGAVTPASQQIDHGANASFTVTPTVGYTAAGNGGSAACGTVTNTGGNVWTAGPITGACAVNFTFSQNQYTVTPVVVGNGSVSPNSPQTVAHGVNTFFILTPAANHRIASVTGCGGTLVGNSYQIANLQASCSFTATFELMTYSFGAAATSNGSIGILNSPVVHGTQGDFTVTPATGYSTGTVSGTSACNGVTNTGGVNWETGAITSSGCEISASFTINQYAVRVTTSGGNGTIGDPAGTGPVDRTVDYNTTASVRVTPAVGYSPVFGTPSVGSCSFSDPEQDQVWTSSAITEACEINVSFAINSYTVSASLSVDSPANSASISPLTQPVQHGANSQLIQVAVESGYSIQDTAGSTCTNIVAGAPGTPGNPLAPAIFRVDNVTAACSVVFNVVAD